MEETRWWTWLLLVSAVIAIVLLVAAPVGYKMGASPLTPSLISLALSVVVAALVLIGALILVVVASKSGLTGNRNLLLVALGLSIVPLAVVVPQSLKGASAPPIHDVTTDTAHPPTYYRIVELRKGALNPLTYGARMPSPEKLAEIQRAAYPDIKPLGTSLGLAEAVARAESVLSAQGLEVVNVDPENGIVEAVATTFWFGFKDDVVVRVTPGEDTGAVVDVRSVSRVGQGDIGANAARIMKFLEAF